MHNDTVYPNHTPSPIIQYAYLLKLSSLNAPLHHVLLHIFVRAVVCRSSPRQSHSSVVVVKWRDFQVGWAVGTFCKEMSAICDGDYDQRSTHSSAGFFFPEIRKYLDSTSTKVSTAPMHIYV